MLGIVNRYLTVGNSRNPNSIYVGFFQPLTSVVSTRNYTDPDYNNSGLNLGTSLPNGREFPAYLNSVANWVLQTLQITNWSGSGFNLVSNSQRVIAYDPENDGMYWDGTQLGMVSEGTDPAYFPSVTLQPVFRYFPNGLPSNVALATGEVALFTGPSCLGAAVITTMKNIPYFNANYPRNQSGSYDVSGTNSFGPPLYEPTMLPGLPTLGTSFQLGLKTSALVSGSDVNDAAPQVFNQLTCTDARSTFASGLLGSMTISVETIDMVMSTDNCEYCNLAGADFSGHDLSNVKLQHANLNSTILSNANLSNADLRSVTLQSATLLSTNLEGASLCSAQLNALAGRAATTLTGAHLKNTNLAGATLGGVKFSYASFYSATPGSCQTDRCGTLPSTCAGAYGATIDNAKFDSSYLSNVDMGNATGVAVDFSSAALLGVSFKGAKLSGDTNVGTAASFNNTWLQGSDFTNTDLKFADFTGAKFDLSSSCVQALLPKALGSFGASTVPLSAGSATCVKGQPSAAFCVQTLFTASPAYPATDCTNLCADGTGRTQTAQQGVCPSGGASGCPTASWANPQGGGGNVGMPTSSCNVAPLLCGDGFSGSTANRCW